MPYKPSTKQIHYLNHYEKNSLGQNFDPKLKILKFEFVQNNCSGSFRSTKCEQLRTTDIDMGLLSTLG